MKNLLIHHLNIEVTGKCNQRCFYCFNDSGPYSKAMTLPVKEWLSSLSKLKRKGLRSVHLTGGEPFVYKNIIELMRGCQEIGLDTSILSNGLRIESLANLYPEVFTNLTVAQISLDSLDEATHNKRRGSSNAFMDAMSAIKKLRKLKVSVEISMTVDDENTSEIDALRLFALENGAKLLVRPMVKKGRANEGCRILFQTHDSSIVTDRFYYVTELPINHVSLINMGYLTVQPSGRITSEHLNKLDIKHLNGLAV